MLYVGVGDAHQPKKSQRLTSVLGKVLRMTLDGDPAASNPFYEDQNRTNAKNYAWAYGFRNPFGLHLIGDRLFVADTGPTSDRFLEVRRGDNYLWDGSNQSMATNAATVLVEGDGITQVSWNDQSREYFPPGFESRFFLTITGSPVGPTRAERGRPGIVMFDYDLSRSRLTSVPKRLLAYRGEAVQVVGGSGLGPDGLYFVPIFPDAAGLSAVFKITYAPEREHLLRADAGLSPGQVFGLRGCQDCHKLGGNGGSVGPALDPKALVPRLHERLTSDAYVQAVRALDGIDREPFASSRKARAAVRDASGVEQVRLWISSRIKEPRFDDPSATMPQLGITDEEADALSHFLVGRSTLDDSGSLLNRTLGRLLPSEPRRRDVVIAFIVGVLISAVAVGVYGALRRWRRA